MQDQGYGDDYEAPAAAQYLDCTPFMSQSGTYYYFQLGCADGTSQALAINLYSDNTCETRIEVEGNDDVSVDVDLSSLQVCNWSQPMPIVLRALSVLRTHDDFFRTSR